MTNDHGEDRQQIWLNYLKDGGQNHRIVAHMFLDYSRYFEVSLVMNELQAEGVTLNKLSVLDYGCGVGDYGMDFLRNGAKRADFYDYPRATQLVTYRLNLEGLKNGHAISADHTDFSKFHKGLGEYDLIIFGEVLEHLDNPLSILKMCNILKVKYMVTSSYPYRTDDPADPYWHNHDHDDKARLLQPECRELLEKNYDFVKLDGELRLWTRK